MHTCNLPDMTFLGTTVWEGAQLIVWNCPECEDQWVWDARRGWQNMEEAPNAVARLVDLVRRDHTAKYGGREGQSLGKAGSVVVQPDF